MQVSKLGTAVSRTRRLMKTRENARDEKMV